MDYLMTTRRYNRDTDTFTNDFSGQLSYVKYNSTGTINVRTGQPDAKAWMREVLALRGTKEIMIYVHGFNTTHDSSRIRLNQIRQNTVNQGFKGVVIGLDWPSKGKMRPRTYRKKRKVALDTGHRFFVNGLKLLKLVEPDLKIHIMAHSMGAYLTSFALQRHGAAIGEGLIDQVIFIAPDIERYLFEGRTTLNTAIERYASRLTCYHSESDKVLEFALGSTHFPRIRSGYSGMRNVGVSGFEGVACHKHFQAFIADRRPPPKWDYSHRWHFDDKVFIQDTVAVLAGKPKTSLGQRRSFTNGDQLLA